MPSRPRAHINPAVLKWAREQARLTIEQTAKKVNVTAERYASWEDGDNQGYPTIKQLRKLAQVLHRPPSLFYLAEIPAAFQPMKDFRRLPGEGLLSFSPELAYEMELAQQRRELSLELSTSIGEDVPEFSLRASIDEDPEVVGERIRQCLGVDYPSQSGWKRKGYLEPFKAWRSRIEGLNVLVFQMSRVDSDEASGFALAEDARPVIVVNRKDVPNRRTFSLLHEFVHLMLGQSGASYLEVDATRPPETQAVEVFCNAAAAAALVPRDRLLDSVSVQRHDRKSVEWDEVDLHELAAQFGVSRLAILRRLLTFGRTNREFYSAKAAEWKEEWEVEQQRRRSRLKESARKFRRNPPRDVFYELGRPFVRLVLESMKANVVTLHEASGHFGNLRIRHFSTLERQAFAG